MTAAQLKQHRIGLALVALAALCWSAGGIFIRVIDADLFTMLFWRGVFSGTAVWVLFFFMEGRKTIPVLLSLRWPALAVALFSASGMIFGNGAIRYATAADAMVIYATLPFATAGIAYLALGERPSRSTLLASLAALAGVGLMMWGSDFGSSLFGQMLAVGMTLSMALMSTLLRAHREVPMLPSMALSGYLCAAFCAIWATPFSVSGTDFVLCAMFGVLQNATGLALYVFGSKRVPAAEATLVAALEVPFTPLWLYLILNEVPGPQTLIGGAVVLAAMALHMVAELRRTTAPAISFDVPTQESCR